MTVYSPLTETRQYRRLRLVQSVWLSNIGSQSTTVISCNWCDIGGHFDCRPIMVYVMEHNQVCIVKLGLHG